MARPISQLLTAAKYKNHERTKKDLLNVTKLYKTLSARLEKYTFPTGVSKELICLDGTIPVTFRDAKYNIPIGVYISENHPFEAPICYVRPTRDMTIKTSRHVDGSGRVYLPYLSDWTERTSDLIGLIQVMQIVFGQMCPVYQRAKDFENIPNNVAMPPPLPNPYYPGNSGPSSSSISMPAQPNPVYPFSSQPQPYSTPNSTGTITEEHIRASLLSAVEDRLRHRFKEKLLQLQDEIDVLKRTSNDLNRGKSQLDEMKIRMASEIDQLTDGKKKLQDLDDQLQEFITKYDKEDMEVNPDEVYGPTQPLFKQILDAFAEENALVDTIYYTTEGMRKDVISLECGIKMVRELSRQQIRKRFIMTECRKRASLPI